MMTSLHWPDGFSLRPMDTDDIGRVHQLESATNPHPWTPGIISNCLETGDHCWLLEKNGELAGYGIIMVAVGEGTLLNIAVAPNFQRQGLGQKLLNFLAGEAKRHGAEIMFLEVRISNNKAIELYLKNDFAEVGTRKNYYPAGGSREDAIVMMRDLSFLT